MRIQVGAPLVAAEQEVGRANGFDHLRPARSMIALVRPWLCATARKAAPSVCRPAARRTCSRAAGHVHAELVAEEPQRLEEERDRARLGADRHRERVDDDVLGRDAVVAGDGDDLPRDSRRRSGSIGMSSSFASAITAAPCFATIGRIASSRSSSPVTELTSALPSYAARPASSASITDESMQSGRSVRPCTSGIACGHQADLVGERIADVDVEHVGAARDLLRDVDLELREVARLELGLERLAAGRVDPLADHAERPLRPDDDGPRPRLENGIHSSPFRSRGMPGAAERCDARLAAEADQVQAGDAGQRARVLGELARDLEALRLGIGGALAALDQRSRHRDARNVLVDEAQRARRARRGRSTGGSRLRRRGPRARPRAMNARDAAARSRSAAAGTARRRAPSSARDRRGSRTAARPGSRPRRGRGAAPGRACGPERYVPRASAAPRREAGCCRGRTPGATRARRRRSRRRRSGSMMFSIPCRAAPAMSASSASRLRSRQTSCMTGSIPSCFSAIATASGEAWACAAVLSVAFAAST